jgi:hypothetical protein
MIISVGYRVNSKRGTQFRIWATNHLRDFLLKGYLINEKRLRENQNSKLTGTAGSAQIDSRSFGNQTARWIRKRISQYHY